LCRLQTRLTPLVIASLGLLRSPPPPGNMAFGSVASLSLAAGLLCLVAPCDASRWQAKAEDVEVSLIAELSSLVRTGQPHALEAALRPIYAALPKNGHGNLEPASVPSALDRLFMQRPGWSVKGLKPGSGAEAWVPAYLQKLVTDRVGERGLGLRELAALAASLEDVTRKEAEARLESSYETLGLPVAGRTDRAQVARALRLYAEDYLSGGASATPTEEGEEEERASSTQEWLARLEADQWMAGETHDGKMSFKDASRTVLLIERQLSRFKSQECSSPAAGAAQSRCLDVSSLYLLCCRGSAEGPTSGAPEPSAWMAAWTDFPGLWNFSLACFLLTAVLNALRWLCGCRGMESLAQSEEACMDSASKPEDSASKPEEVAKPEEAVPSGLLGTCAALCVLCAAAVAVDLLDITIIAPALAVGLALLAAASLAPKQHVKAKKV